MPETEIHFKDVWVSFDRNPVLEAINLKVSEREIISIVGPNGAGKTTLLYLLLGLIKPNRGTVTVKGMSPKRFKRFGHIGYLPQNGRYDHQFPVNAYDVIAMGRYAGKGLIEKLHHSDIEAIERSGSLVNVLDLFKRPFGQLSTGQKQRVLIARALALNPDILVLDEPSTGLDAVSQEAFYQLLCDLRDGGLTIVMVSHDIGTVSAFVDRIACLNRRIHFHGRPEECIPSEALEKVFGSDVHFLLHDKKCESCEPSA